MNMGPIQRAEGLAKKHGTPMYVYANPERDRAHPYVISDVEPAPHVWPMSTVHPDGRHERRPYPGSVLRESAP